VAPIASCESCPLLGIDSLEVAVCSCYSTSVELQPASPTVKSKSDTSKRRCRHRRTTAAEYAARHAHPHSHRRDSYRNESLAQPLQHSSTAVVGPSMRRRHRMDQHKRIASVNCGKACASMCFSAGAVHLFDTFNPERSTMVSISTTWHYNGRRIFSTALVEATCKHCHFPK
jgi:hypothetical protein